MPEEGRLPYTALQYAERAERATRPESGYSVASKNKLAEAQVFATLAVAAALKEGQSNE